MGRPVIDLAGQKFNYLTVIKRNESKPSGKGKSAYWICQCECGNIVSIRTDKLRKGIIKSCGCYSKKVRTDLFLKDLAGQKFGKLVVLKRDLSKPIGKCCFAYWVCQCECGNITSVRGDHLRNHTTGSCGCINSKGENLIREILIKNNVGFKAQYSFPNLKGDFNSVLRFDFAIFEKGQLKYLIEYQGEQHYRPYCFDTEERFLLRQKYDQLKRDYCKKNNVILIEIPYTDFSIINMEYIQNKVKYKEGNI